MGQHDKTIERVLPVSNRPLQHNDINVGNKRSQRGQHVDAHNGQGLGLLPNDDQLLVPTMDAVTHPNTRLHGGGGRQSTQRGKCTVQIKPTRATSQHIRRGPYPSHTQGTAIHSTVPIAEAKYGHSKDPRSHRVHQEKLRAEGLDEATRLTRSSTQARITRYSGEA